jgi:hypothetical protein
MISAEHSTALAVRYHNVYGLSVGLAQPSTFGIPRNQPNRQRRAAGVPPSQRRPFFS